MKKRGVRLTRTVFLAGAATAFGTQVAASNTTCVVNQTDAPHFFRVETIGKTLQKTLKTGDKICVDQNTTAFVRVSEYDEDFETCEHMIAAGRSDLLLHFEHYQICEWSIMQPIEQ